MSSDLLASAAAVALQLSHMIAIISGVVRGHAG